MRVKCWHILFCEYLNSQLLENHENCKFKALPKLVLIRCYGLIIDNYSNFSQQANTVCCITANIIALWLSGRQYQDSIIDITSRKKKKEKKKKRKEKITIQSKLQKDLGPVVHQIRLIQCIVFLWILSTG